MDIRETRCRIIQKVMKEVNFPITDQTADSILTELEKDIPIHEKWDAAKNVLEDRFGTEFSRRDMGLILAFIDDRIPGLLTKETRWNILQREDDDECSQCDDGSIECVEDSEVSFPCEVCAGTGKIPKTPISHNHKNACKAYARRLREYADTIEQYVDAPVGRDRGTLTGAIYRASRDAKAFADRHRNNLNIKKED